MDGSPNGGSSPGHQGPSGGNPARTIIGEVHTGLLQNSASLPSATCALLLSQLEGERVRRYHHPIEHAVSPDVFTGVDCPLAVRSGPNARGEKARTVRGVGTVACHTAITGGRVAQAASVVELVDGTASHRRAWSHYLARPGIVELIGTAEPADLARGFATPDPVGGTLDLGAISGRTLSSVQSSPGLDRRPPFRFGRTRLRWAAVPTPDPGTAPAVSFRIESEQLRTALIRYDPGHPVAVAQFCEDLALHDWLLAALLRLIERSGIGAAPSSRVLDALRPAVDHLIHLWMPAARVDHATGALWEILERRPGLSRQWDSSVNRIRDQIALLTVTLLANHPAIGVTGTAAGRIPA